MVTKSVQISHPTSLIDRIPFIDQMRGFIFILMAFDHALHAYAANWGRFWFYRDYDRSYIFDALYLFNQSAIMPILFFTFGAYVLPKIRALGLAGFWKDRLIKHGLPFLIGIPLIVPLLSYPKFHEFDNPGTTYMTYWLDIFFSEKLQAGPYWVMYAIVMYTAVFLLINKVFPRLVPALACRVHQPSKPLFAFLLLSVVVYGLSDLRWGAPWWIGLKDVLPSFLHGQLFSLQASKFIMNFVYFCAGAVVMESHLWENKDVWTSFLNKRYLLLVITGIVGVCYTLYADIYFADGAYNDAIYRALRMGDGSADAWSQALALFPDVAPGVLIRTTLLGILALFQTLTVMAFFAASPAKRIWVSAAACCWGIFMIHDPIVIWMQFWMTDWHIPIVIKTLIAFVTCLSLSWAATSQLLKIRGIRRVFELD